MRGLNPNENRRTESSHPERNVHRKTVIVCDKLNIYTEAGDKSVSAPLV